MSLWHRLYYWLGLRREHGLHYYELDESLHLTLSTLASREGRTENQLAADLLAAGLTQYYSSDDNSKRWRSLSRREQDVSALACLGYTNRQMAARLGISTETIKTHMHSALIKFNLRSKADLRVALAGWDFSAWSDNP